MIVVPSPSSTGLSQQLLADKTYDIEFHGYLSNHVKHAIVALDKLGAPEERIQEYWDNYTRLTPYQLPLHKVEDPTWSTTPFTAEDWTKSRGQKVDWQKMVLFLTEESEKHQLTSDDLVKKYAPPLLDGIAGALTHGIIHLGWGIDAQSPWMVQEGLAYLNFCHVPMAPIQSRGLDETDAVTSALRVAETWQKEDLGKTWIEPTKAKYDENFHPELVPAGFQWHLAKVLKDAHPVATVIPSWIQDLPLEKVYEELYRLIAVIYLTTRARSDDENDPDLHGNFVVLHLFTSLWGLEHTCKVINDEATTRQALEHFWAMGICILSTGSAGFPSKESLEATLASFDAAQVDDAAMDWVDIVKRGCAEEEEHNIKLVYVARELWNRYGCWKGFSESAKSFTLTPKISPAQTVFSS